MISTGTDTDTTPSYSSVSLSKEIINFSLIRSLIILIYIASERTDYTSTVATSTIDFTITPEESTLTDTVVTSKQQFHFIRISLK
jgi:hypothetical protein